MATEGEGDWTDLARQLYEEAVFAGESTALERGERQLDAVEAYLVLARGRLVHTRQRQDDVEEQDGPTALELFERSAQLAEQAGTPLILSYALRHLGIAAHASGDLDGAHQHLTESTRLREEIGFAAGVAANLVGLAYVASAHGRGDEARTHLDRAEELGHSSDAAAVLATVVQAREHV